ncbi:heme biosynthesis protein HemY [Kordiimonas marina]|uniref:heme biosynthesis protein HemY n=1 Tax=Kordiimonas marina TaxID=2872312 RepID=UPI001FF344EA|nr:hypothetical protein [Kordiimonas marina]
MIRLVLLFAAILAAAAGAAWLADHPGNVTIDFEAYRIDTSFAALTLFAAGVAALSGLFVWLAGWIRRDMPVFGTNQVIKRQSRGFKILNQSLVALSAGDHKLAQRLVGQAEVLLPPQPMIHLIAAEAATRSGNHAEAAKRYKALEATEDGRLIGLRGLVHEARRTGRENEALQLTRTAFKENRKSPWVLKTLFSLEVSAGNWQAAAEALGKVAKEGLIDAETVSRHKGALAYAEAAEANLKGDHAAARKGYKKALSARAGFTPAVIALAKLEQADGSARKAEKIILNAWEDAPHPGLARVYKSLDAAESMEDWLKRARTLAAKRPAHPESMLLLADAMMDAHAYDDAAPILERLTRESPSREAWQFRLALAHVKGENPDPVEAALAHAPDGAVWRCTDCGHTPAGWAPLCPSCHGFDTIEWGGKADITGPESRFDPSGTIALLSDSTPKA